MTLVDPRTGEVMQQMTEAEALEFVSFILTAQDELPRRIIDAYQRRVWLPLGYSSWDEMCREEGIQLRLPREDRQPFVMELRSAGMSTRAIGSALGTSHTQVQRDLDSGGTNVPTEPVIGTDGKSYLATQPPRAQALPQPTSTAVEDSASPAPSVPTRDLGDVLEERMPGTRADLARTSLRARWSRDMASAADIDLLDPEQVRAVIEDTEASVAIGTLRRLAKWADRMEQAGRPGLRIVGGNE